MMTVNTARSIKATPIKSSLIAPCGMNCRLCRAFVREKNPCPGCRIDDRSKPKTRVLCRIKQCGMIKAGKLRYCSDCGKFPCDPLQHLDTRYRTKYGMSMIENLGNIKRSGVRNFIRQEESRWACSKCGEILCVHKESCIRCGSKWR